MKKILAFTILVLSILATMSVAAQQRLSTADRQKYLAEMRTLKHEFFTRELDLTKEQQAAFFPIYDEMEDQLLKTSEDTRQLETKVTTDAKASDLEVESASRAIFEQKLKEGKIEIEYYDKFKEILKPRQLLSLKNAERKFTQQLVRQHRKMRD